MNIETDLVKKKVFSSSMNPSIQKHSQEYKVLAILRYLYPQKFSTMINGEAPDLQDNENGVGIEVVSAASENDMRASRAFSELHQTKGGDKVRSGSGQVATNLCQYKERKSESAHRGAFLNAAGLSGAQPKAAGLCRGSRGRMRRRGG